MGMKCKMKSGAGVAGRWVVLLVLAGLLAGCFPLVVAGVGTGVAMAADRRTTAAVLADQQIDLRLSNRIAERFGDRVHVNINSYNRAVLLTGEVADEASRTEVERLVASGEDVRVVHNELTIGLPSTLGGRTNDVGLSAKTKARMIDSGRVSPLHVKVTVERSVVYLMGLVSLREAKDAAEVASRTMGVERVVTLFEYLD